MSILSDMRDEERARRQARTWSANAGGRTALAQPMMDGLRQRGGSQPAKHATVNVPVANPLQDVLDFTDEDARQIAADSAEAASNAQAAADDALFEAEFGGVTADRIRTGTLTVGTTIQSANYDGNNWLGWFIAASGNAEFNNVTIRGSALVGGSMTAGTFQTRTAGSRVVISSNDDAVTFWNTAGVSSTLKQGASLGLQSSGSMRVGTDGDAIVYCGGVYGGNVANGHQTWRITDLGARHVNVDVGPIPFEQDGIVSRANTTGLRVHHQMRDPNGSVGTITSQNGSTNYNTSSDHRLKEQVVDADPVAARDALLALQPRHYRWIAHPDRQEVGFLAHELADVLPHAVTGDKDAVDADGNIAPQGVDLSKVVPLIVAVLRHAFTEIDDVRAQLPEQVPIWVQPQGAHDAYNSTARPRRIVRHNGQTWETDVANNVWEPGVYGWTVVV